MRPLPPPSGPPRAFSLVEVMLALGLVAFCLVSLIGLISVGLRSQAESREETEAAALAASIAEDLRNTGPGSNSPHFNLGALPLSGAAGYTNQELYLTRTGAATNAAASAFALFLAVTPPARDGGSYLVYLSLEWPGPAARAARAGRFELLDAFQPLH